MNLQNRSTGEFFESAFFSEFTPSLNTHDIRPQVHYNYDDAPDALVSPRLLTDSSQNTAISYTYYPYGESTETVTDSDASANRYRYTGREYETGYMNFYRSRYYNNRMGRFFSKDTWQGEFERPLSINKYLYVEGNSINFNDPTGKNQEPGETSLQQQHSCLPGCWWDDLNGLCVCGGTGPCHGYHTETGLPYGKSSVMFGDWPSYIGLGGFGAISYVVDSYSNLCHFRNCADQVEKFIPGGAPYYQAYRNNHNLKLSISYRILVAGTITVRENCWGGYMHNLEYSSGDTGHSAFSGSDVTKTFDFKPMCTYYFDTNIPDSGGFNYASLSYSVYEDHVQPISSNLQPISGGSSMMPLFSDPLVIMDGFLNDPTPLLLYPNDMNIQSNILPSF